MRNRYQGLMLAGLICGSLFGTVGCGSLKGAASLAGVEIPEGPSPVVLVPTDVDARLEGVEGVKFFGREVSYKSYKVASVDGFFKPLATLEGTIAATEESLRQLNAMLESGELEGLIESGTIDEILERSGVATGGMTKAERKKVTVALLSGNTALLEGALGNNVENVKATAKTVFDEKAPIASHLMVVMPVLVDALKATPTKAMELVAAGQGLVVSAPAEFTGSNAMNLPAVLEDLKASVGNLEAMKTSSEGILTQLGNLVPSSESAAE